MPTIHCACFNRRRVAFCPSIRERTTVRTIPRKLIYLKYFTSNRYLAAIKLKRDREKQKERERERKKRAMVNGQRKQRRGDAKWKISAGRISLVVCVKRRNVGFKSVSRVGDEINFARCNCPALFVRRKGISSTVWRA